MYTCDVHMRGVDRTDTMHMQAERLSSSKVKSVSRMDPSTGQGAAPASAGIHQ